MNTLILDSRSAPLPSAVPAPSPGTKRLLAAISSVLLLVQGAIAADGALDPAFGTGGKVTTDFFGGFDGAFAIATQSDGRILAAGFAMDANFEPMPGMVRYLADGSLDPTFGIGGRVLVDPANDLWGKVDVAIQNDGGIVLVGTVGSFGVGDPDFGVVRFDAHGNLDTTFGVGGMVVTDFGGHDEATSVAIQSDGKIVVAGVGGAGTVTGDFAVARYLPDGSLDPSFGAGGKVATDLLGSADWANDVAIQADGKIVVAGNVMDGNFKRYFGVVRHNADGTLDGTFSGGKVTTEFFEYTEANAVVIQPADGMIVVAGTTYINVPGLPWTGRDFALARYQTDGTLDGSFGNNGIVTTDVGGFEVANGLALQADGKIVAAGSRADLSDVELHIDFGLVRYDTGGVLDPTFGSGGTVVTDFQFIDVAGGVALQPDCRIVAAGYSWPVETGNAEFALARYDSSGCVVVTGPCPWSQGHWKNNPNLWPVDALTLGSQSYSKSELLTLLNTSAQTDASLILTWQLIAAKLNLAKGSDPAPVASVIAHADSLLAGFAGKLPYQVKSSSAAGQAMVADAAVLNDYNKGLLTPGCNP